MAEERRLDQHTETALAVSEEPPPPSVFAVLRQSNAGATGSPSPHAAGAGRGHVAHVRAKLDELLRAEPGSPSAESYAEAMCTELERGADPNELLQREHLEMSTNQTEYGDIKFSTLQAACTWWWTDGCDYDPRPIVAALLRHGADPNLRCDPIMGPGSGFLRPTTPGRYRRVQQPPQSDPFRTKWAGHTALWQTCALAYYTVNCSTRSGEYCWSPADDWLDAQLQAASAEEREEHACLNRRRRKRWDTIGALTSRHQPTHMYLLQCYLHHFRNHVVCMCCVFSTVYSDRPHQAADQRGGLSCRDGQVTFCLHSIIRHCLARYPRSTRHEFKCPFYAPDALLWELRHLDYSRAADRREAFADRA